MKSIVDFLKSKLDFLWSQFNRLNPREKNIATVMFVVVLALVADYGIIKPLQQNIETLNKKIAIEEKKVLQNMRSLNQKAAIDTVFSNVLASIDLSKQTDEEIRASMLHDIEQYARAKNVYLSEVKPQVSGEEQNYTVYRVRLQLEGTMQEMLTFLAELVRTKKLYIVETLRVVPHPEDVNKIKAQIGVARLILQNQVSSPK